MSVTIPKGILGYTWYKLKQIFYSKESIEVNVELERDRRHNHLCSVCNNKASPERRKQRTVKDLLFHGWKTSIVIEYYAMKSSANNVGCVLSIYPLFVPMPGQPNVWKRPLRGYVSICRMILLKIMLAWELPIFNYKK